jgi:hypothetical protein
MRAIFVFDGTQDVKMWVGPIAGHKSPEARFQWSSFQWACRAFTKSGDECLESFTEAFGLIIHGMPGWA